ncbi:MAG: efflux RND transporter periplasmic adaptor subunit [Bacteroidetes bacterium]|nr:efflux RND transporter periplasmic adaptor subunit [Bacteroidota bacterium]
MHLRNIFSGLLLVISFASLYSCTGHDSSQENAAKKHFCLPDSLLKNITFDTLKAELVNSELALAGKITCNEDNVAKIFPLVSGQVAEVKVSVGDYVEKGKVLAVIRSSDMANYYNEFRSSQSELAIAKKNLEVTAAMKSSGVSSDKDFLIAQNEYQKAIAQYNKISEVLKIYGSSFSAKDSSGSGYVIKSPISGFVVDKNITTGKDIRPDDNSALFIISDLKDIWAVANVFETDIEKVQIGSSAEITTLSYPDKKFNGKVERISNILDPETKVMSIRIRLENPEFKLKPGMFAHFLIRFPENIKMLAVKSNTIIFNNNRNYILRFGGNCDVIMAQVKIFKSFNGTSFIESSLLHEGDLAIARNGLFVFTALEKL